MVIKEEVKLYGSRTTDEANEIYDTLTDKQKTWIAAMSPPPQLYTDYESDINCLIKSFLIKENNIPVSVCDLWLTNNGNNICFSVMTRRGYQGKGYASKVIDKAINYLNNHLDEFDINNVYWTVESDNIASQYLAKKYGFKYKSNDKQWLKHIMNRKE